MSHRYPGSRGRNAILRRPILLGALVFGLVAIRAWSAELTADEKAFLDRHFSDVVKVEYDRVSDPAVLKVFATPVYIVTVDIYYGEGSGGHNIVLATRRDDKLVGIARPGTDGNCPAIQQMFRPDFRLRNDDDARVLQAALDAVFPLSGSSDQKAKTFRHAGHKWTFVRGPFFDAMLGFVMTTDSSGAVTGVEFVLKLP
jgi:hypothetical protein